MRFEEALDLWQSRTLNQEEAALLLGVCDRTFRRYIDRYEDDGLQGLIDKRMEQVSQHRAPVDEVLRLEALYKERYDSWNVKHFFERYEDEHKGQRSYTWVKNRLQERGLVKKGKRKGQHRKRRDRAALIGLMIHQDASTHYWVPNEQWDLVITMDDADNEVYSAFVVEEEGTLSSFTGVRETIEEHGIFSSFYSDRGSHYWFTPEAGAKVDRENLTQFGRALGQLGIQMIAAYSPEARGRSERMFKTWQDRLPKELALAGITTMAATNRFIKEVFLPRFNKVFKQPAREAGSAFVPMLNAPLKDILCLQEERTVRPDNCVSYKGKILQIPADRHRYHYVKAKVKVHEYEDGSYAIFYGPRKLANYDESGVLVTDAEVQEAVA
ncbi:MAG: ISNCY family transposase [Proteobacteria bacterium]|nr:ISNCY family transposase [Pseudomonadota bacterium]